MKRGPIRILLLVLALLRVLVGGSDVPPADRCLEVGPCRATASTSSTRNARVLEVAVPIVIDVANRQRPTILAEDE